MWQQTIHSKGLMTVDLLLKIFKRVTNCDVILLSYGASYSVNRRHSTRVGWVM